MKKVGYWHKDNHTDHETVSPEIDPDISSPLIFKQCTNVI